MDRITVTNNSGNDGGVALASDGFPIATSATVSFATAVAAVVVNNDSGKTLSSDKFSIATATDPITTAAAPAKDVDDDSLFLTREWCLSDDPTVQVKITGCLTFVQAPSLTGCKRGPQTRPKRRSLDSR